MTAPLDLDALEALAKGATPGPYDLRIGLVRAVDGEVATPIAEMTTPYRYGVGPTRGFRENEANGRFIVGALNAFLPLLAEVRRLREEFASLAASREEIRVRAHEQRKESLASLKRVAGERDEARRDLAATEAACNASEINRLRAIETAARDVLGAVDRGGLEPGCEAYLGTHEAGSRYEEGCQGCLDMHWVRELRRVCEADAAIALAKGETT